MLYLDDVVHVQRLGECFEGHCRETHSTQCHHFGNSEPCLIEGYECVAACMLLGVCTQIGAIETKVNGNEEVPVDGPCEINNNPYNPCLCSRVLVGMKYPISVRSMR